MGVAKAYEKIYGRVNGNREIVTVKKRSVKLGYENVLQWLELIGLGTWNDLCRPSRGQLGIM